MLSPEWLKAGIYAITASHLSLGRSNIEIVRQMLQAGVGIIQYREKEMPLRQKYQECLEIREMTAARQACFIVNDDVALAMAVKADGVHLGQTDLPLPAARGLVGNNMIIGISTHSPDQLETAISAGIADYAAVGPIFRTQTKKDVQEPVGLGYLDYAIRRSRIPLVAIGGIKESNVAEVIRHGARLVCLVSEIVEAPDIPAKINSIRVKIKESGYLPPSS